MAPTAGMNKGPAVTLEGSNTWTHRVLAAIKHQEEEKKLVKEEEQQTERFWFTTITTLFS